MTKKLKTLDEHNKDMHEMYRRDKEGYGNGIACPSCGAEMYDSRPGAILCSYPPQKDVSCRECGYKGYAVA